MPDRRRELGLLCFVGHDDDIARGCGYLDNAAAGNGVVKSIAGGVGDTQVGHRNIGAYTAWAARLAPDTNIHLSRIHK